MDPFADPFAHRGASRAPEWRPRGGGRVPGEIGIWVFILGDLLIFGLFFIVFVHERSSDRAPFASGRETLSLTIGAANTLLLLTGSLFVVVALHALRRGASVPGSRFLLGALVCGAGFVVDKFLEYSHLLAAGHTPLTSPFYMYYYMFTVIHLVHLLIGMVALTIMYRISRKAVLGGADLRHLEAGGIFWHLVDLLWIVLFALLYLVR